MKPGTETKSATLTTPTEIKTAFYALESLDVQVDSWGGLSDIVYTPQFKPPVELTSDGTAILVLGLRKVVEAPQEAQEILNRRPYDYNPHLKRNCKKMLRSIVSIVEATGEEKEQDRFQF